MHSDELRRSGVVVLLSGGGPERLDEATRLMRGRYAELLLLTDTTQVLSDGTLESAYMRLEAIERGVSPEQIQFTQPTVTSTRDEADKVLAFLTAHQITGCIVVTDPYHTRRTRMIFANVMAGSGIELRVVASRGHWYAASSWFLSPRGWQTTISEYIKLGYYLISRVI